MSGQSGATESSGTRSSFGGDDPVWEHLDVEVWRGKAPSGSYGRLSGAAEEFGSAAAWAYEGSGHGKRKKTIEHAPGVAEVGWTASEGGSDRHATSCSVRPGASLQQGAQSVGAAKGAWWRHQLDSVAMSLRLGGDKT